jgi:hypothetical protein
MPATNSVEKDIPEKILNEIKETFVFRDGNVYNKKTGRQLKRYERQEYPPLFLDPNGYGYGLYFKLKSRIIPFPWAKDNLVASNI